MALTRAKSFPFTVTVDGQIVHLTLKRMSPVEFEEYRAMLSALGHSRGAPASMADNGVAASMADLHAEMEYLKANVEWQLDVFDAFVTVQPGDVTEQDEHGTVTVVTNGRQFAAMFPGHSMIRDVLLELFLSNGLTEAQKKTWQSLRDSRTGSTDPASAPGERPAPTATSAAPAGSAEPEAATAPDNDPSSGTTDPSLREPVPCAI